MTTSIPIPTQTPTLTLTATLTPNLGGGAGGKTGVGSSSSQENGLDPKVYKGSGSQCLRPRLSRPRIRI